MKLITIIALTLATAACGGAGGEPEESAITNAAEKLANQADAEINRQIDELEAQANAEMLDEGEGDEPVTENKP
jgi:hypothetical protein